MVKEKFAQVSKGRIYYEHDCRFPAKLISCRFPVKLISSITFGSTLSASCLLKSNATNL